MSIKDIQKKKTVRYLFDVNFDSEDAHLAYTNGAASLKDEPYLLKQNELELTEEQETLLKELTESSEAHAGEELGESPDTNLEKGNDDNMSVEILQKQLEEMQYELAVEKAVNKTVKYSFEEEANVAVVKALATLSKEDQEAILKAFDVLVGNTAKEVETAVEKALETKEEIKEENPLKKALDKEEGHSDKVEVKTQTLVEKALEIQNKNKENK